MMHPRLLALSLIALLTLAAPGAGAENRVPSAASALAGAVVGENGGEGGLARWEIPALCPLVSGLSQAEGEFVLQRVTQIAQEAGVPLAPERCTPTLYILVSADPVKLLKGMEARNRSFTFSCGLKQPGGDAMPGVIDTFIQKARPVRIWYNTTVTTTEGLTLCADRPVPLAHATSTRLKPNATWALHTVFVVVDSRRLKDVTREQLADYVSLVGLARMNPEVPVDSAPTILRVFAGPPGEAPAQLTVWDRAFLKVIYADKEAPRRLQDHLERRVAEAASALSQ